MVTPRPAEFPTVYRKRGDSRDRRPDLPQFVLCVVVNREGWPIAWEIFPGNTADVKAFAAVVNVLRDRSSPPPEFALTCNGPGGDEHALIQADRCSAKPNP